MLVRVKTKHGRTFWRFGIQLKPDEWTELDATPEQLAQLRKESVPLADGGVLDLEEGSPPARTRAEPTANARVAGTPNAAAGKKAE